MAEAFGVAASVAGIVSLGLEVFSGIVSYIDAIQRCDDEIDAINRQAKELQRSLHIIKGVIPELTLKYQDATSTVLAALESGEQELKALKDLVAKLSDLPGQQKNTKYSLTRARKKATFPFHQGDLEGLQQRLQRANIALQAAMSALGLVIMSSIDTNLTTNLNQANSFTSTVRRLETDAIANTTLLRSDLLGLTTKLSDILDRLPERMERDKQETRDPRTLYHLKSSSLQLENDCDFNGKTDDVEHEFTIEERGEPTMGSKRASANKTRGSLAIKRYMPGCMCQQRRQALRRQAKFGTLLVNIQKTVHRKHLPECRFAKCEDISQSNSILLSYHGLQWLTSKAFAASLSLNTGPGGLSISPSIIVRPTVDHTQSPIFQTMEFLCKCLRGSFNRGPEDILIMLQLIEVAVHRIVQLYMSRRRSPYEINSEGQSALHGWTDVLFAVRSQWEDNGESLTEMTTLLLETGLPASLCDLHGASPGTRLIKKDLDSAFSLSRITDALCEEAPEASVFETYYPGWHCSPDSDRTFLGLRNTIQAAEIVGCGLLTSAILHGDEANVGNIISRYPSTLHEKNLIYQTPFHLAVHKPRILRILMASASSHEFDTPDSNEEYALDYALRLTPQICSNGNSWVACSNCPCSESAEILLASGWRCRFNFLEYCDSKMSHTARLKTIHHLVSERATLKALGQRFLPSSDIKRYRIDKPSVLDNAAHRVAEVLVQTGVNIPASVRATLQTPELSCLQSHREICGIPGHFFDAAKCPPFYTSTYHMHFPYDHPRTNQLMDFLYCNGFHDVNQIDSRGYTPLSHHLNDSGYPRPSHITWLLDHGASLTQKWPVEYWNDDHWCYSYSTYTVAQFTLRCTSYLMGHEDEMKEQELREQEESLRRLVSLVAPMDLHDDCHCRCIEQGCHTMKVFLEYTWIITTHRWRHQDDKGPLESASVPAIAQKISEFLSKTTPNLSNAVSNLALRYFTFEVLDLRHTCCEMPYRESTWSAEEIEEIADEDHEKLELFELLLRRFQAQYLYFQNHDETGHKLASFLTTQWSPGMQQVLADAEVIELTEEEKRKAKEVGVQWELVSEKKIKEEKKDLDYWLRRLDKILPAQA